MLVPLSRAPATLEATREEPMSTTRTTTIWCDADGCSATFVTPAEQLRDARRLAKDVGWRSYGATDFCPIGGWPEHEAAGFSGEVGDGRG